MKRKNVTGLSKNEIAVIKEAFDLYDTDHTGFANISDIKESLVNLGYEQKNPVLFDIIAAMDTEENARKGGISFFQFIEEINDKLDDKETPEGLRRIFDLFSEGTDIIKKENVVEICGQIAKEYDDPELHEALDRCAKNATNLTFDEFESIMTKKAYP
jgi:Ca2+-binding EF-hand superfamily protein